MPIQIGNQGTNVAVSTADWKRIANEFEPVVAAFVSKYKSLTPAQKTEIISDVTATLSAYDPATAANKDNAMFAGIMVGIVLAKFVREQLT